MRLTVPEIAAALRMAIFATNNAQPGNLICLSWEFNLNPRYKRDALMGASDRATTPCPEFALLACG
jgi:hypothetical protein